MLGDTPLNQADPDAIRSLVGKREARGTQTLEDVIEASEDSDALREALESYANKYELMQMNLQGTLGKSFGAGIPGIKSIQVQRTYLEKVRSHDCTNRRYGW